MAKQSGAKLPAKRKTASQNPYAGAKAKTSQSGYNAPKSAKLLKKAKAGKVAVGSTKIKRYGKSRGNPG